MGSKELFADLHCHLGGSTPLWVSERYLRKDAYADLVATRDRILKARSLSGFVTDYFRIIERMQHTEVVMRDSAHGALTDFSKSLPPGSQGHLELRFCPFYRSLPVKSQLIAVSEGLQAAASETGATWKIVLIAERGNFSHMKSLGEVVADPGYRFLFHGVDVAGMENGAEQDPSWIEAVVPVYKSARDHGMETTYHVGEGLVHDVLAIMRSDIPLDRIGHGVALRHISIGHVQDLAKDRLFFEMCPVVNELSGVASLHDVVTLARSFYHGGVKFGWCSDNPVLTGTSFYKQLGLIPNYLANAGLKHSAERLQVTTH